MLPVLGTTRINSHHPLSIAGLPEYLVLECIRPYVTRLAHIRTKRFIVRIAKEWNSLPPSVFQESYNLDGSI